MMTKERMISMKTSHQGNAIVLTVPTKFRIDKNIDYLAVKGLNDSITFIKKKATIFGIIP